ncbi:hypothetical protein V8F33_004554 [Rhypophila sp. PSN 637]
MGFLDDAASVISGAPTHHSSRKHKSHRSSRHKDRSRSKSDRSRSRSRHRGSGGGGGSIAGVAASVFGFGGDDDSKHKRHSSSKHHHKRDHSPTRSFFGSLTGSGGDYNKHNASRSSFFGGFGGNRSPSYYKRSPRPNFLSRLFKKLKRLLRDLMYYAKKHPMKVFMLVIMPLITGGALTALLAKFGLRLPATMTGMLGLAGKAASGDGIGLVGEVAKMASSATSGGTKSVPGFTSSVYEKRTVQSDGFGSLGDIGKSVGGLMGGGGFGLKGVAKMFS